MAVNQVNLSGGNPERLFELPPAARESRPPLPDTATGIGRIALVVGAARPEEILEGQDWYLSANKMCVQLAEENGVDVETAAGVVAALSPRLVWEDNVARARAMIRGREVSGLSYAMDDAKRIMAGESVEAVLFDPARSNYKVRAFYRNISDPWGDNGVTIDRHMWAVLFDKRGISDTLLKFSEREYRSAEEIFRGAARFSGFVPSQLQAITWIVWRRIHGVSLSTTPHATLF